MIRARLEAVLNDAAHSGPRELSLDSLADLKAACRSLGFPFAHIDLAQARNKDDLLAALANALGLPQWFGHNWDALTDCLCDLSWNPAPGYLILIEGHDALRASNPQDFDTLIDIFTEAANHWRGMRIPFWTLLTPTADGKRWLEPLTA